MKALIVFSTAPKVPEAEKIAQTLVQERLVACVNLVPQIDSRYWWEGKIDSGQEVLMIMKTLPSLYKRLEKRIHELHSYDVPEVLAMPVVEGSKAYLAWMKSNVAGPATTRKRARR